MSNELKNIVEVRNGLLKTLSKIQNGEVVDVPHVKAEARHAAVVISSAKIENDYNARMRYSKKIPFLES